MNPTSTKVDFVGPSNPHKTRKFDPQRTVNLFVANVESGSGKAKHFLQSIPGLNQFSPPPNTNHFTLDKSQTIATGTVGDAETYTILVTNGGPEIADGATITDNLPAEFTFASCDIAYVDATGPATATEAELLAGITVTTWAVGGTVTLTIAGAFNDAGTVDNTGTVQAPPGGIGSATDTVTAVIEALPVVTGFDPAAVAAPNYWVLSAGNTTGTFTDPSGSPGTGGNHNIRSINGRADKRYFEFVWAQQHGSGGQIIVGVGPGTFPIATKVGYNTANPAIWGVGYDNGGRILENGGEPNHVSTYGNGDVVMIAIDPANGHFWAGLNGTWNGNPAAGTGYVATAVVGETFVMVGGDNVNFTASPLILYQGTGRFLAADQDYAAPAGFTAWDD